MAELVLTRCVNCAVASSSSWASSSSASCRHTPWTQAPRLHSGRIVSPRGGVLLTRLPISQMIGAGIMLGLISVYILWGIASE